MMLKGLGLVTRALELNQQRLATRDKKQPVWPTSIALEIELKVGHPETLKSDPASGELDASFSAGHGPNVAWLTVPANA